MFLLLSGCIAYYSYDALPRGRKVRFSPAETPKNKSDCAFYHKMIYLIYGKTTRKRRTLIMTCQGKDFSNTSPCPPRPMRTAPAKSTTRRLGSRAVWPKEMSLGLRTSMVSCGNAISAPATERASKPPDRACGHLSRRERRGRERPQCPTGEDIESHGVISEQFPAMKDVRGQVLLVTDGSTLLGADDKAGVAEITTAVEKLIASGAPHGSCASCSRPTRRSAAARRLDVKTCVRLRIHRGRRRARCIRIRKLQRGCGARPCARRQHPSGSAKGTL